LENGAFSKIQTFYERKKNGSLLEQRPWEETVENFALENARTNQSENMNRGGKEKRGRVFSKATEKGERKGRKKKKEESGMEDERRGIHSTVQVRKPKGKNEQHRKNR